MELTNEQWTALGKRAILIEQRAHDAYMAVLLRDYAKYATAIRLVDADARFAADMISERALPAYPCNQRDGCGDAVGDPPMMMGDSEGGC